MRSFFNRLGTGLWSGFVWICQEAWRLFKKLPWYGQAAILFFIIAQFDRNLAVGLAMIGACFLGIYVMCKGLVPKKKKRKK